MPPFGPLAPLFGALAMIGLAVATLFGRRRAPVEPPPAPGPREDLRASLSAFAHWLARQPAAVRDAVAAPTESLLTDGAELIAGLTPAAMEDARIIAAHSAITRDLPATTNLLDRLPTADRTNPDALAPFTASIASIAAATSDALAAIRHDGITRLEIQQTYLNQKFPDKK